MDDATHREEAEGDGDEELVHVAGDPSRAQGKRVLPEFLVHLQPNILDELVERTLASFGVSHDLTEQLAGWWDIQHGLGMSRLAFEPVHARVGAEPDEEVEDEKAAGDDEPPLVR